MAYSATFNFNLDRDNTNRRLLRAGISDGRRYAYSTPGVAHATATPTLTPTPTATATFTPTATCNGCYTDCADGYMPLRQLATALQPRPRPTPTPRASRRRGPSRPADALIPLRDAWSGGRRDPIGLPAPQPNGTKAKGGSVSEGDAMTSPSAQH